MSNGKLLHIFSGVQTTKTRKMLSIFNVRTVWTSQILYTPRIEEFTRYGKSPITTGLF